MVLCGAMVAADNHVTQQQTNQESMIIREGWPILMKMPIAGRLVKRTRVISSREWEQELQQHEQFKKGHSIQHVLGITTGCILTAAFIWLSFIR